MEPDKVSYKSPYYADLNAGVTQRNGLPAGLLDAIVTRGERSNADQVSSAKAQTVYQIIPETRDAALKKWGIDAYQSPENAAEVAGRLLKESLDRNKGAAPLAVAEYIGGTDPKNWGTTTRDYVKRVTGTPLAPASSPDVKQSTFDRIQAANAAASTPSIAKVVAAYKAGTMDPESRAEFEADVSSGKVLLPRGVSIGKPKVDTPTTASGVQMAPAGVIEAYTSGKMTPEERHEFESDVAAKRIAVPEGVKVEKPKTLAENFIEGVKVPLGAVEAAGAMASGAAGAVGGTIGAIAGQAASGEMGTAAGTQRAAEVAKDATQGATYTPRTDAGQDFTKLAGQVAEPLAALGPAAITGDVAQAAAQGAKPIVAQAVNAVESRLPQVAVRAAGGDVGALDAAAQAAAAADKPRVVGPPATLNTPGEPPGTTYFSPEAIATAKNQGRVVTMSPEEFLNLAQKEAPNAEKAQALKSLTDAKKPFTDIPELTIREKEQRVLKDGKPVYEGTGNYGVDIHDGRHRARELQRLGVKEMPVLIKGDLPSDGVISGQADNYKNTFTIPPETPPPVEAPPVAPSAAPAAPEAGGTMTAEQLAATTRKAAGGGLGSGKAMETLANESAPHGPTVQAMDELGFHYQPDHVTTNQAFRELAQAVKSVPGSETRAAELQALEHNAGKADEIITQLGGTHDLSSLSAKARDVLGSAYASAKAKAGAIFKDIENRIDPVTPTPATDTVALLNERARRLGGADKLSAGERSLLSDLNGDKPPTYAFIDAERKALNEAKYNNQSKFGSTDARAREQLIESLRSDQGRVATTLGAGDLWEAANAATRVYKGIQADLVALFGKQLDGSIVGNLKNAVGTLSQGDVSRFVALIKAIPMDMRQEVVASGLSSAFGKNARNGSINFNSYAKWFEGLQKNKVARDALFSNLPPEAVASLTNLYKASKGISMATRERITTGRIQAVSDEILKGDTLMSRVFDVAKKAGAAEVVGHAIGLPGVGTAAAIASALTKGRTSAMRAADALINSPEFIAAARKASQQNIARLARSKSFTRFMRESKGPKETKERERWIVGALQAKGDTKK